LLNTVIHRKDAESLFLCDSDSMVRKFGTPDAGTKKPRLRVWVQNHTPTLDLFCDTLIVYVTIT